MSKHKSISLTKQERREKTNAFAVIFLFFLYSLTTLPGLYISQSVLTMVLSVVVFFPVIIQNLASRPTKDNFRAIFIELVLLLILLLELIVYEDYSKAIQESILYLITLGTIGLVVGSLDFDIKECYKYGKPLAYICFVTSLVFLWLAPNRFLASMRFGYAMLPSVLWFLIMTIYKHSLFNILLFAGGAISLLAWGSRGTLLVILLFIMLYLLKYHKKIFPLMLSLLVLFSTVLRGILIRFLDWISNLTQARKIDKIISMVDDNSLMESSSGRDVLYDRCMDVMLQEPMGNGVGWWSVDPYMYGQFPHNIVLQIGTEFGLIGLTILLILIVVSLRKAFSFEKKGFLLLVFIVSITMGRLMVSSMYWARPEFWLFVGLFVCNKQSMIGDMSK